MSQDRLMVLWADIGDLRSSKRLKALENEYESFRKSGGLGKVEIDNLHFNWDRNAAGSGLELELDLLDEHNVPLFMDAVAQDRHLEPDGGNRTLFVERFQLHNDTWFQTQYIGTSHARFSSVAFAASEHESTTHARVRVFMHKGSMTTTAFDDYATDNTNASHTLSTEWGPKD